MSNWINFTLMYMIQLAPVITVIARRVTRICVMKFFFKHPFDHALSALYLPLFCLPLSRLYVSSSNEHVAYVERFAIPHTD